MGLSVPSYVIPGTYLENARFLQDKLPVSGIELLFFLYDQETRRLYEQEAPGLEALRGRFSYTLHLPDTLLPAHEELVELTAPMVDHYIVHPPRDAKSPRLESFLPRWIRRYGEIFLLENTRYDLFESSLQELPGVPLCCDTGHLLLEQRSPAAFFRQFGGRIRQVHLHTLGMHREDRLPDHRPLEEAEPWLLELLPHLERFTGPVELELFAWEEVETTISLLENLGFL